MALATQCLPEREPSRLAKTMSLALRRFRDALRYQTDDELDNLSLRYLRDVGVVSRLSISQAVETEITGISLRDSGWAKPRRRLR